MRIHIICDRPEADRILPRKARYLMELNEWTLSEEPSSMAELNYFLNYIPWRQRFHGWHETPIGAYFTHYDNENEGKARWWTESAEAMDLIVTSSKHNLRWLPSGVRFARPPVEVDRFTIAPAPKQDRPVVGVSGFVYGDGRKGEKLISKLATSKVAKRLRLVASGRGWPVPTRWIPWREYPAFLQSLDVLVCPSLFEGVPMPPIEAMACGVKVVIPTGVGIMDDLPDLPGIYRYKCGDAGAMIEAVERAALEGPVGRGKLRGVIVNNYTPHTWAADHLAAVEGYLYSVAEVENLPDWKGVSGVYVVAFGDPSRRCAVDCINSIHQHMPGLPVALASPEPLGPEDVYIQHKDSDIGGRRAKIRADELAPAEWKYVLYLDADITIHSDISFLFKLLQGGWELAICKDMDKYSEVGMAIRPDNKDECDVTWDLMGSRQLLQYNGGMMAFRRCERTSEFFKMWQEEWDRWGKRDQAALLRALYRQPLRLFLLMNQWNATDRYDPPGGEVAIWHHNTKARRWGGIIKGRTDSTEAWLAVENWKRQHA